MMDVQTRDATKSLHVARQMNAYQKKSSYGDEVKIISEKTFVFFSAEIWEA